MVLDCSIWDIARKTSSCVYASGYSAGRPGLHSTRSLLGRTTEMIPTAEITLLYAAHAYAQRVRNARRICAVGSSVSFETLANFAARVRFITALKSLSLSAECPVLLKIEEIPAGTPQSRLAEMISMLSIPNLRFALQYVSHLAVPEVINIRLGAAGLGCPMPKRVEEGFATVVMKKLVQTFASQKGFVFMEGLDDHLLVRAAALSGVRFCTGACFGAQYLSGTDSVPAFPLLIEFTQQT